MKTLAILADIHGNRTALQAVLDDLERQGGADHMIVLGDLAVFGPDPRGVLTLLQTHEPVFHVCGNTDRYLVEERYPANSSKEDWQSQVLASFPWTANQLGKAGLNFLAHLPRRQWLDFTGEHSLLAVHGSPRSDEENICPDTAEIELREMLPDNLSYTLLLCAHTHVPVDRIVAERRVVNVGSVGLPFDGDPRASYALIHLVPGGEYLVEFRRVAYDIEAVVAELVTQAHPATRIQAYNLRTARRLDPRLIYTQDMRQGDTLPAETNEQKDFQAPVLSSSLVPLISCA